MSLNAQTWEQVSESVKSSCGHNKSLTLCQSSGSNFWRFFLLVGVGIAKHFSVPNIHVTGPGTEDTETREAYKNLF